MNGYKTISWFSAGVSSAVATKLMADKIDCIFYIHIDDHHLDSLRFVKDCEKWFGKPIFFMQSPHKCVENALLGAGGRGYVNGPAGAPCTRFLKRRVRREWEIEQKDKLTYIWGMDISETHRVDRLKAAMPECHHVFPLINKDINKEQAHKILKASGIKRPAMYDLGYNNNNCIGCVKGGMGYWNKIRIDFPNVFRERAKLERRIGGTCIKGVYLDELDKNRGRNLKPICEDCGIFCEIISL
ncbi:hypothetical protein LCGC14_0684460 [marine sediment metagenome]|uniref:Phosphoadenosine phosphosulphate reductase domain-containing protein n=1 Tax=marine sediment metagenome TaxID=412755 RepID=A0A0F9TVB3_9ZZZZ